MKIVKNPDKSEWKELLERPASGIMAQIKDRVETVVENVRKGKDAQLLIYEQSFDKAYLKTLDVSQAELDEAASFVPAQLRDAIDRAAVNIRKFHESQLPSIKKVETTPGVTCWQKAVPITKVGLYIPGGTAPLFSTVLMLAIPARTAGCQEIVLCTPPNQEGNVNPAILYAAQVAGVNRIFKLGGAQAIAAMAYGTESVPKVSKIFGPGNPYVTTAKQIVSLKDVAIDMPAGPSEVEVIADAQANPAFVAADLLSQAEHGRDSQVILLTTSAELIDKVQAEVDRQLALLPRNEIARVSLINSRMILLKNDDEIIEMTNEYAPEHLIIQTKNASELAERVVNAGSVFIGPWSPESAGDYASGTNHTLPTSGYAKAYSGVNIDSFMRKITFQELTKEGLRSLGPVIETMAAGEYLDAHKNAVSIRLADIIEN
ncbi:MAG: histidinol dehydrogenase [Bacteroidaceae bacterium]|nr:histidinol dehydrogenase [Bacteroidaceae bacterium]